MKPDKETLTLLYRGEDGKGRSLTQLGELLGVDRCTVWKWMRDYGIKRRNSGKPIKLPCKTVLHELYVTRHLSTWQIARLFGVTDACSVRKALIKHGIPRRPKKHVGVEHCIEPGCNKKAHKIKHAGNGSMYGTRCKYHRTLHYAELNRYLSRKYNNYPAFRWRNEFEIPEYVKAGEEFKQRKEMESVMQGNQLLREAGAFLKSGKIPEAL